MLALLKFLICCNCNACTFLRSWFSERLHSPWILSSACTTSTSTITTSSWSTKTSMKGNKCKALARTGVRIKKKSGELSLGINLMERGKIGARQEPCVDWLILKHQTTKELKDIHILTLLLHTNDVICEWPIHVPLLEYTYDLRVYPTKFWLTYSSMKYCMHTSYKLVAFSNLG